MSLIPSNLELGEVYFLFILSQRKVTYLYRERVMYVCAIYVKIV